MLCEGILSVCACVYASVPLYLSHGVSSSLSISHSSGKDKGGGERMGWGRAVHLENTSGVHRLLWGNGVQEERGFPDPLVHPRVLIRDSASGT